MLGAHRACAWAMACCPAHGQSAGGAPHNVGRASQRRQPAGGGRALASAHGASPMACKMASRTTLSTSASSISSFSCRPAWFSGRAVVGAGGREADGHPCRRRKGASFHRFRDPAAAWLDQAAAASSTYSCTNEQSNQAHHPGRPQSRRAPRRRGWRAPLQLPPPPLPPPPCRGPGAAAAIGAQQGPVWGRRCAGRSAGRAESRELERLGSGPAALPRYNGVARNEAQHRRGGVHEGRASRHQMCASGHLDTWCRPVALAEFCTFWAPFYVSGTATGAPATWPQFEHPEASLGVLQMVSPTPRIIWHNVD